MSSPPSSRAISGDTPLTLPSLVSAATTTSVTSVVASQSRVTLPAVTTGARWSTSVVGFKPHPKEKPTSASNAACVSQFKSRPVPPITTVSSDSGLFTASYSTSGARSVPSGTLSSTSSEESVHQPAMYLNVEPQTAELFHHRFVRVNDLYDALDELRYRPFSHKAERDVVRAVLLKHRGERIVSAEQRFPDGLYIDMSEIPVSEIMASLLHALDCSDKPTTGGETNHHYDVAYLNARKCMTRLMEILTCTATARRLHNIYTRDTFEERFGLNWQ